MSFPISEILNELIVAMLLECGLAWTYVQHEPDGHRNARGDWQFRLASGKEVFVEVKSIAEPAYGTGPFAKPRFADRIRGVLKRGYRQLPADGRATVMILVADGSLMLDTPFGLEHGDLFQAFFGETVVTFDFDGMELSNPRLTSTFRDMFVQRRKNRRLGAAFGLELRGVTSPAPNFYAIHNPFVREECALPLDATRDVTRFYVNKDGTPHFEVGVGGDVLWSRCTQG